MVGLPFFRHAMWALFLNGLPKCIPDCSAERTLFQTLTTTASFNRQHNKPGTKSPFHIRGSRTLALPHRTRWYLSNCMPWLTFNKTASPCGGAQQLSKASCLPVLNFTEGFRLSMRLAHGIGDNRSTDLSAWRHHARCADTLPVRTYPPARRCACRLRVDFCNIYFCTVCLGGIVAIFRHQRRGTAQCSATATWFVMGKSA